MTVISGDVCSFLGKELLTQEGWNSIFKNKPGAPIAHNCMTEFGNGDMYSALKLDKLKSMYNIVDDAVRVNSKKSSKVVNMEALKKLKSASNPAWLGPYRCVVDNILVDCTLAQWQDNWRYHVDAAHLNFQTVKRESSRVFPTYFDPSTGVGPLTRNRLRNWLGFLENKTNCGSFMTQNSQSFGPLCHDVNSNLFRVSIGWIMMGVFLIIGFVANYYVWRAAKQSRLFRISSDQVLGWHKDAPPPHFYAQQTSLRNQIDQISQPRYPIPVSPISPMVAPCYTRNGIHPNNPNTIYPNNINPNRESYHMQNMHNMRNAYLNQDSEALLTRAHSSDDVSPFPNDFNVVAKVTGSVMSAGVDHGSPPITYPYSALGGASPNFNFGSSSSNFNYPTVVPNHSMPIPGKVPMEVLNTTIPQWPTTTVPETVPSPKICMATPQNLMDAEVAERTDAGASGAAQTNMNCEQTDQLPGKVPLKPVDYFE
eukprot:Filipodium_phascolosomae@DN4481_c0_g1_i1.p1